MVLVPSEIVTVSATANTGETVNTACTAVTAVTVGVAAVVVAGEKSPSVEPIVGNVAVMTWLALAPMWNVEVPAVPFNPSRRLPPFHWVFPPMREISAARA